MAVLFSTKGELKTNMNRSQFMKRLHTEKSVVIQQYQPIYIDNLDITVNKVMLDNIAHVKYQNGHELALAGKQFGVDFLQMDQRELNQSVTKMLTALEGTQQEKLWHDLGLDTFPRIHPLKSSSLPYFVLDKSDYCRFAYCPIADDKFAMLIHNDYGKLFQGTDGRAYGAYGNDLRSLNIEDGELDRVKIASALCDYEPSAVWQYEENDILKKIEQMTQETNARPFIFSQSEPGTVPIVSLPEEASDYLSKAESELAEKLIVLQENSDSVPIETDPVQSTSQETEEEPIEEAEMEMSM